VPLVYLEFPRAVLLLLGVESRRAGVHHAGHAHRHPLREYSTSPPFAFTPYSDIAPFFPKVTLRLTSLK